MAQSANMAAALKYIGMGLAVLPLHMISRGNVCSCGKKDCSSPGKHPLTQNGLHDASCDEQQIMEWWTKWPYANVGIVTGKASGIFVIDIDGPAGEDSLEMLETDYGPLPETWEQLTGGGGRHLVFQRPDLPRVGNKVRLAPGLDVRGDDGYIVAEPSNHISGKCYYWEASHHPDDTPLAELPAGWVELLTEDKAGTGKPVEIPDIFPQGERNNLMFKLGASLRARGLSDTALSAALREENRLRCNPPLQDGEVETIVQSCCRYAPGDIEVLRASRAATAPEAVPAADMEAFRALIAREPYYSDAVVGAYVQMETDMSPSQYEAMDLIRASEGFRDRQFTKAIKQYKARKRGLSLVNTEDAATIPTLEKRLQDIPVHGLIMPMDWRLTDKLQIMRYEDKGAAGVVPVVACPHPVFPIARLHNLDTGTEKIRVAFRRDGHWQDIVAEAATVSSRSIVNLSNYGLQVTSETCKTLITFLSDFATTNRERLPLKQSTARLGWIGTKRFAPYDSAVAYDGDISYQCAYNAVRSEGKYEDWRTLMLKLRQAPILRIAIAASFASPLVALLGYQPFFLHLWGNSGAGKTVAQQVALSVWGDPAQLIKTLNTTAAGLERHAAFYHSLPVALDELQAMSQKFTTMDDIIYRLALGKSKGRATGSGGVEQESEWRNIFLTSGEEPISQDNTAGGARNRVIELYMDAKAYANVGMEAGEVVMQLMDMYGHAGKEYITALIKETGGDRAPVKDTWQKLRDLIRDKEYTDKHINNVSMLALGDYYASRLIFGEADDQIAMAEAVIMAVEILERIDRAAAVDPINRAWSFLADWVEANRPRFAMEYEGTQPRLGWITLGGAEDGSDQLLVIPQQLRDALRGAGYSPAKSIKGFADMGWMRTSKAEDDNSDVRYTTKARIGAERPRVYVFGFPLVR